MKLTKEDIGKQFNTRDAQVITGFAITKNYFIGVDINETPIVYRLSGLSDEIGCDGLRCSEDDITSRHDPRSWLSQMPNLGDIKDGWIACDNNISTRPGRLAWRYHTENPMPAQYGFVSAKDWPLDIFNMPTLTGDQWKDSKISVAELKQWQADNEVGL